jgi:CheY-like chemotaxis protein
MVTHPSILLIEDSPGERELFRLALVQTGLDVVLFTEQDAEAAFRFLEEEAKVQAEAEWKHTGSIKPGSLTSSSTLTSIFPPLPCLILLDLHLGSEDGCALLKRLRADARFATIPVVIFTTSDAPHDLARCQANGGNGYVVKPGTFAELIQCTTDICRFWLNRNRVPYMVGTPC